MKVKYKCSCMRVEAEIDVPDRLPVAPIEPWMENTIHNIAYDHSQRSPHCRARKMDYVMIPLPDGSPQIGTPATRN